MRSLRLLLCLLLWLVYLPGAEATSRVYHSPETLIAHSDVIAIVRYAPADGPLPRLPKEGQLHYRKASSVTIVEVLKGVVPERFTIHHGSQLDDHLFQQGAGKYLVFLKKSDDTLIPTDGWTSSKRIQDGYVTGWNNTHRFNGKNASLSTVRAAIKAASTP